MIMAFYEIPTINKNQQFTIVLNSVKYTFTIIWSAANNTWVIDIGDYQNTPIISGIPMVANVDLLKPFEHLNFSGKLIAVTDSSPNTPPTSENLGTSGHLYWVI